MSKSDKALKNVKTSADLLSYIINVTPELKGEIDLPVQGESIQPIGKIIINNDRYKNAFINTVNLIGLTVLKRNGWENPWNFTKRGTLRYGQQVRELINDLANVYDYNETLKGDVTNFLKTEVPNVYNYIHEINFQKYYKTTTDDTQLAMAFDSETSLFDFVDDTIGMLAESLDYDTYLVDKYQLCRRILDGTVTSINIPDFANLETRQVVGFMKGISNLMTFRSPNYNPAGIRKATKHEDQRFILNCVYDGKVTTEVLATSFFRNDAEMQSKLSLIDSFKDTDSERLTEVLGDAYIPFTEAELEALDKVIGVIISDEWFMDYAYALNNEADSKKYTEFYNPETLKNNHWLHYWGVFSTSPFENAVVFTSEAVAVTSVTISPDAVTVSAGQEAKLTAVVETTGFANKAVTYSSSDESIATVDASGVVKVASDATSASTVTITATSVYDDTKSGTATITVA
jgi:hypothetical protein